jgi:hypothetical protein
MNNESIDGSSKSPPGAEDDECNDQNGGQNSHPVFSRDAEQPPNIYKKLGMFHDAVLHLELEEEFMSTVRVIS